ncbi:transposase, partial [Bacillus wiedmannii]
MKKTMYTHGCYTITWRGFFMAKKGTTFNTYSNEIKLSAVQSYLNGEGSYDMIA